MCLPKSPRKVKLKVSYLCTSVEEAQVFAWYSCEFCFSEYVVKVKEDRLSDEEEEELDEEEIPFDHKEDGDGEQPQWPQADLIELFSRIESLVPVHDHLVHSTRAERLDWDEVN